MLHLALVTFMIIGSIGSFAKAELDAEGVKEMYDDIFKVEGAEPMDMEEIMAKFDEMLSVKDKTQEALTEDQWKSVKDINRALKLDDVRCNDNMMAWMTNVIGHYYRYETNIRRHLTQRKRDHYTQCMEEASKKAFPPGHRELIDELYKMAWNEKTGLSPEGIWKFMQKRDPTVASRRADRSWRNFMTDYDNLVRNMCIQNGKQLGMPLRMQQYAIHDSDLRHHSSPEVTAMMERQALCDMIAMDPAFLGSRVWFLSLPHTSKVINALNLG